MNCTKIYLPIKAIVMKKYLNRFVFAWGGILLIFAAIMYSLLTELEFQTFREDIAPWKFLAVLIAVTGGITAVGGTLLSSKTKMER